MRQLNILLIGSHQEDSETAQQPGIQNAARSTELLTQACLGFKAKLQAGGRRGNHVGV